jgi:hypothetical protein
MNATGISELLREQRCTVDQDFQPVITQTRCRIAAKGQFSDFTFLVLFGTQPTPTNLVNLAFVFTKVQVKKGAMVQADYKAILTDTIAVDIPIGRIGKVLLEDNHYCHGHGLGSTLHQFKKAYGIRWQANIPTSPDLNVIEKVWRILKQRVKAKGHPLGLDELRGWIQAEWDAVDQDTINRYIDDMPNRAIDICRRGRGLLPY